MQTNIGRRKEDLSPHNCSVHYQFVHEVSELNKTISVIGEGVKWIKQIGRWVIPTLLALCLMFGGSMITIAVKVAELDSNVKQLQNSILGDTTNGG